MTNEEYGCYYFRTALPLTFSIK